jgi:hypothetical protein
MVVATQSFLEPLQAWAEAMSHDDFPTARRQAQRLILSGELLAVHPDFRRCFAAHCDGVEPRDILSYLGQFLVCATDARAMMRFTQEPRRPGAPPPAGPGDES